MLALPLNLLRITSNTNTLTALNVTGNYSVRAASSSLPKTKPTISLPKFNRQVLRQNSSATANAAEVSSTVCPHFAFDASKATTSVNKTIHHTAEWKNALPYNEIPGPKPIPILGNTWRFSALYLP